MSSMTKRVKPIIRNTASVAVLCLMAGLSPVNGQDNSTDPALLAWQQKTFDYAHRMRGYFESGNQQQQTPPTIPQFETDSDPSGRIATLQPSGPTQTSQNAFFSNIGTNERTCFSCHQPQNGWTVSAASIQDRFNLTNGTDPIFRLVDGATCPTDKVNSLSDRRKAYSLLLKKGLIRVFLPVPTTAQYRIVSVNDPYGCNTNPVTGLTTTGLYNPTAGMVSIYRRPLPSTNLGYLATIMWDGREPSLTSQTIDATLIHAQAAAEPSTDQQTQMVNFESGLFTAQSRDNSAGELDAAGAAGGPGTLATGLPGFYIGINDPVPAGTPPSFGNPFGTAFSSIIFELYKTWSSITGSNKRAEYRQSVARGETLFNTAPINITGVTGVNDLLGITSLPGVCGTCHDTPNVGNHSRKLALNIGVTNGGLNNNNPVIDIADLPVFTIQCVTGPLDGQTYVVTDPGKALISGSCADIGKTKGPILRGLASRAPYFHNGSAATLLDVVNFYDQRFNLGLTDQNKTDLVNFLNTL
jgi:cytochrome c peroxidase